MLWFGITVVVENKTLDAQRRTPALSSGCVSVEMLQ